MNNFLRNITLAVAGLVLSACPSGDDSGMAVTIGGSGTGMADGSGDGVDGTGGSDACILNNCSENAHCDGCSDGRNFCLLSENRCVRCDPAGGGAECEAGEICTEFGNCIPADLDCPVDGDGVPIVDCGEDAECGACDPLHQVCVNGACKACTTENTDYCQTTDECIDNQCVSQCPASCTSDSECANCGEGENAAHACHKHHCAECSETLPCPAGQTCSEEGVCIAICGIPGQVPGTCEEDADCAGCEGDNDSCNAPINGGHGVCGPSASGCSDLGNGVVVLPAPFDEVTNLCSNDGDCAGIGVMYNVGQLLRDLTGLNSIDDAIINYPMPACANVTVGAGGVSISCGVCVPCREDDDCMDIDIDMLADDLFGALGGIAAAILLDQLFGDNDHLIHMFCQPIAGDYGICVPCPTLLNDCVGGGGGGGSGMCDHNVTETGTPLDPSCGDCAAEVCAGDDYCCTVEWDQICVDAAENCGGSCHDWCTEGDPMSDTGCGPCVTAICMNDPFCCQTAWDGICVGHVATEAACTEGCLAGCAHSPCDLGGVLDPTCDPCVDTICGFDSFCCNTEWDSQCVDEAATECPQC